MSLRPETEHMIVQLQSIINQQAREVLSVDDEHAALLADEIATSFFAQFGGSNHYIPSGRVFRSSKLHRAIWEDYNGRNARDLQSQFKVSIQYIYRVLKREGQRVKSESQAPLPGV